MLENEFRSLINEMEEKIYNYQHITKYHHKMIGLYNINKKSESEDILKLIKFEIDFLSFKIKNYKLEPLWITCPKISEFSDECIDYLKSRCNSTTNLLLKSYYSWILYKWHDKDSLPFLQAYINSLWKLYELLKENSSDYLMMSKCLSNAYFHAHPQTYENHEKIKEEINKFLTDETNTFNPSKKHLINFISQRKISNRFDLAKIARICWNTALEESNPTEAIEFLKIGEKLDKNKEYEWNSEIACNYEKLIDLYDDNHVKFRFCRAAINHYKPDNKEKIESLTRKIEEIQKNMAYSEIHTQINMKKFNELIDNKLNEISSYTSEEFIDYLINNKEFPFIPKATGDYDFYNSLNSPIEEFISREVFDNLGNSIRQVNHDSSEEEIEKEKEDRKYLCYLSVYTSSYLNVILEFAFYKNLFTYETIMNVLKNVNFNDSKLLEHIKPLIKEYFRQLTCEFVKPNSSNFTLFIDSIQSKLEIFVRYISESNDIITTQVRTDDVTQKFRFEQTLKNEDFINLTKEYEDHNLLKYILIEPGLNLRNKSSHGLDLEIYSFSNANLLIVCFLRLIKYI